MEPQKKTPVEDFTRNIDLNKVKEELTKKLVADGLPEEAVWLSGAEPGSDNYTAWFAGADGLHILFQQYQVAPYAYGIPEVTIPWNKLKSLKQ